MVAGAIDPDRVGAAEQHGLRTKRLPLLLPRDPQSFSILVIVGH